MKLTFLAVVGALFLSGCAVKYAPAERDIKAFDEPEIGALASAQVGDHLLRKGVVVEEEAILVKNMVDGILYDILPGEYQQLGYTEAERFYLPTGIVRNPFADEVQGMSVQKDKPKQICVITVFAVRSCYDADFEVIRRASSREMSFQQTLIYSGRVGNKINIGYREFSNNTARPAFNNDVEYDLSASNKIGYKGAQIEVIEADNSGITYKVLKSFK
ncbi:hypothetical protein [Pusillimonas minor]|uniref:Lipoprotein n=1 Tax=Pusillimonas minor TaxID=2697024 RepID=A0A842HQC0_9BURK|nr:hypothetical protein [Pusillimonas minor]MBC2770527.1 hypothetical protein [Pusillimonas minor]